MDLPIPETNNPISHVWIAMPMIQIRVTPEQKAEIRQRSLLAGHQSVSEYIRKLALNQLKVRPTVPDINQSAVQQLRRMTEYLCQLVLVAKKARVVGPETTQDLTPLHELIQQVNALRLELTGRRLQ